MKKQYLVATALAVGVALALLLVIEFLPMRTRAQSSSGVKTGQYTGNGGTTQVNTGLAVLRSLQIVELPFRGPSSFAYTTNTIQATYGSGIFINGNKRDSGVAFEVGNFTVTNADFNISGSIYHWEAHGD
jgi:hypothetical protein